MRVTIVLLLLLATVDSVLGQQPGHYDLMSVNESIQGKDFTVSLLSWEQQTIEITVEKPMGVPLAIRLRGCDQPLISRPKVVRSQSLFREIINLSQLEPGRYWLEIWIGKHLVRRELRLEATSQTYRSLTMH